MVTLLFINLLLFKLVFAGFLIYMLAIFLHSMVLNKNLVVAFLSVPACLLQFFGYGLGFLRERLKPYSGK
jgi:hypothetical protein